MTITEIIVCVVAIVFCMSMALASLTMYKKHKKHARFCNCDKY